jgi:LysR family nitrogen assimilation transcriptional regulator
MDLRQLEYFTRVAELGSFTRASAALGIAQPALSRQVRLLEVELRQNLLQRNGRGAVPTEAGKLLLEHGRGILHQVAVAREELGVSRGALVGRVSIGLPPSLARLVTVPLTRAFQQQMPQAQLTLTEGFTLAMHEDLRLGNLDMAVLYHPERSPDMEQAPLHREELALISSRYPAPTTSAVTLRQVTALPLILPSRPNAFRLLLEKEASRMGRQLHIAMEVDGLISILSLVREGFGHAVLPAYTLANFDQLGAWAVRRVRSPSLTSQLMLVRSLRRPETTTQKTARTLLQEVVRDAMAPYT